MKKTALLLGLLSVIGISVAVAEPVPSVNVVGYVNVTVPPSGGYALCALNFQKVASTNDFLYFSELFGTNQLRASSSVQGADRVFLYDPQTQIYYKYAFKLSDLSFHEIAPVNRWTQSPTNPVIYSGQGFWIQSGAGFADPLNVSLLGEVATNSTTVYLEAGFQIYGSQHASSLNVWSNTFPNAFAAGAPQGADQFMLFRNGQYTKYAFKSNDLRWHQISPVNKWSQAGETNPIVVNVGEGFWYLGRTNSTWSSTSPYDLQ